jgi:hypothetical protein
MNNCKICGAPRDPIDLNCKYCGTAFENKNITGETYIDALRTILEKIDEKESNKSAFHQAAEGVVSAFKKQRSPAMQAKLNAIATFAMPTDIESLLQFFMFCHGNASVHVSWDDEAGSLEKEAWTGKAKMAFGQLKFLGASNTSISGRMQEYESIYGANARRKIQSKHLVTAGVIVGFIIISMLVSRMAASEKLDKAAETQRIENSITKTQQLLINKQYEAALIEASNISWRDHPNSNKAAVKQYDSQRELIINSINQAKSQKPQSAVQTESQQ